MRKEARKGRVENVQRGKEDKGKEGKGVEKWVGEMEGSDRGTEGRRKLKREGIGAAGKEELKEEGVGGRGMKLKKREGRSRELKGIKKCSLQLSLY